MTGVVVDASVVVKWYGREVRDEAARRLQTDALALHAPDLIYPEVGNILWKKVRRGDITADAARAIVGALLGVPLTVHPAATLLSPALDLSLSTGRTAYDSLYLALAVALDCPVVTADEKLYNALRGGPLSAYILWVEDVPAAFNRAGEGPALPPA